MRTAMRPRYYCDHCNKGNGSPSAMRRHESGCTLNPARVCRMCALLEEAGGDPPAPPREELLRILDTQGFASMRKAANDCPACILSALRARNTIDEEMGGFYRVPGPEDGRNEWSYKTAKVDWWADYNESHQRDNW